MDYQITKEEIMGTQEYCPPMSFRFWCPKDKKIYDVKEISYNHSGRPVNILVFIDDETMLKSYNDGDLIPSTNIYAKNGVELFYGDIVVCNFLATDNRIRVVYWDNGWRVFGVSTDDFENNAEDMVIRIGNRHEHPQLYNKYVESITSKLLK